MAHSSYSGEHDSATQGTSSPEPRHSDRTSPGQLSLLPEFTDETAAEEPETAQGNLIEHASPKWLTLLGIVLLALIGFGGWRWWQGRSPSPEQQGPQATPVELDTVETATVEETSTFTGTLEAEQASTIEAEQSGRVAQILVQQGQTVRAGTPLVRLSAEREQADVAAALARIDIAQASQQQAQSELAALQAERDRVQAELDLRQEQLTRTETLVERGALAREELDLGQRDLRVEQANLNALNRRIRAARDRIQQSQATLRERQASLQRIREDLQDTNITAPFAGVVGDIPIKPGNYVEPGRELTRVIANDELDLNISIPQERSTDLVTGLPVEISDSAGNLIETGSISFVSPGVSPDSQFIPAEATIPNPDGQLKDGQFVRSEVIWASRSGQPVVPQSAVIYRGEDRFVYVPQEQEGQLVAMRQSVELGLEQGTDVEILSGLQPGQRIIVAGIQRLSDGVPIRPTEQGSQDGSAGSQAGSSP